MIKIIQSRIDVQDVLSSVQDPAAGAIDIFLGTTRNQSGGKEVTSLDYEAYEPMAMRMMEKIADAARSRWPVIGISLVHRVGRVEIGEVSVVVAVSAAHRNVAFDACRFAIDALKKDVPIWKKEVFVDGEVWVGSQLAGTVKS